MAETWDVKLYNRYKDEGAKLAAEGDVKRALKLTEKALAIHHSDKLVRRIEKMKAFLENTGDTDEEEEENDQMVEVSKGFKLHHHLVGQLYQYQREGISWMWELHKAEKGGVLGDDMGLGKTLQVIAFLSGLFDSKTIRTAIILMPVSLITNWNKEFGKWTPGLDISTFHSDSKVQREKKLIKVQKHGGIIITSYGMMVSNVNLFKTYKGTNFVWDYIILDEGHKIKNPTKTTKAVHDVPAKHRLVLTGTPIQNNLRELWALYDFVHQGTLLGSLPTFKMQYENPITRSREKNASNREKILGNQMAESLRVLIAPYFLRRTKDEVMGKDQPTNDGAEGDQETKTGLKKLPQKNDLILWLHLHDRQIQIYDDFTNTEEVKMLLMTKKSPLVALTVLKKICDHPRLLSKRACLQLGMNGEISKEELEEMLEDDSTTAPSIDVEDSILLEESGKLSVLIDLLQILKKEGHRTLVFSQSRKMLDIINNILLHRHWNVLRLDGTVTKLEDRQKIVNSFQKVDSIYPVMLLTTQVGGVGLTLTGADRVVIYDPSWNPATDSQAVDRAYRIGQTKPVVVYRLITCGTVEEKIYRRQIFKDSITRQAMGADEDPHRYFTNMELRELFKLDDPRFSSTQRQLQDMHSHERLCYPELDEHLAHVLSMDIFGISDHDLMFKGEIHDSDDEGENLNNTMDKAYIKNQVDRAKLLLQLESEEARNEIVRTGAFTKDLTNFGKSRLPKPKVNDLRLDNLMPEEPLIIKDCPDSISDSEVSDVDISDSEFEPCDLIDLTNLSIVDSDFAEALEASMQLKSGRKSGGRKSWTSKQSITDFFAPVKREEKDSICNRDSDIILIENSDEEDEHLDDVKPFITDLNQTVARNMPSTSKGYTNGAVKPFPNWGNPYSSTSVLNETSEEEENSNSRNSDSCFHSLSDASIRQNSSTNCLNFSSVKSDKLSSTVSKSINQSNSSFIKNEIVPSEECKKNYISESGDEDHNLSHHLQLKNVGHHSSIGSSDEDIARNRAFGKHRLLDSSTEDFQDAPSPASSDSSLNKKARMTPEEDYQGHAAKVQNSSHQHPSSDEDSAHHSMKPSALGANSESEDETSHSEIKDTKLQLDTSSDYEHSTFSLSVSPDIF